VADGTYTFGRSFTASVQRTADGYVTLRSAAGCLAISGGKLTLNVPLQPGVEATWDTCDATSTLQRWEPEPVAGGYRLVNAITRMALSVTDDGRIVQYPPDQRTPAVWHLS
jgi:hexosaminidase